MKNKKRFFMFAIIVVIFGVLSIFIINRYVKTSGSKYIISNINKIPKIYSVLVLGAHVYKDGTLSPVLEDRVLSAYNLYKKGIVKRFLVSGDHGSPTYDEVKAMKAFLIKKGVKAEDVFTDHAGFRTYDSVIRAKKVFKINNLIIVTQKYHLSRAIYIARKNGMVAYGYPADRREYLNIRAYKVREFFARIKAYIDVFFNKSPKFLGPEIDIRGDSNKSNG